MHKRVSTCPTCSASTSSMPADVVFCPRCQFPLVWVGEGVVLERRLAEGGFGVVYQARHATEHTRYAIKVLHPELFHGEEMEELFLEEMKKVSELSELSEHVVRTFGDSGFQKGLGFWIRMEWLEGFHAEQWLMRQGRTSPSVVLDLFFQLCSAMQVAHTKSMIHGDLKLSNLMLVPQGDGFQVKVLDFGIYRLLSQSHAAQGMLGTPTYMAPEQCIRDAVDARTDIYAMGVLLYELLGGTPPFLGSADTFLAILRSHLSSPAPPLRERKPHYHFSQELDLAVLRALEKYPSKRYASAAEFWNALASASEEDRPKLRDEVASVVPSYEDLQKRLDEASHCFGMGVAHDYGWGIFTLEEVEELPIEEPHGVRKAFEQESASTAAEEERKRKKERGKMYLWRTLFVLLLMWVLTALTTQPLKPQKVQSGPAEKARQR